MNDSNLEADSVESPEGEQNGDVERRQLIEEEARRKIEGQVDKTRRLVDWESIADSNRPDRVVRNEIDSVEPRKKRNPNSDAATAVTATSNRQPISVAAPESKHSVGQSISGDIIKHSAIGATAGMFYPVGQMLLGAKEAVASIITNLANLGEIGIAASGEVVKSAATKAAPFVAIPVATGLLGRWVGKKFNRPGTGTVVGAGVGMGAAHVIAGTTLASLAAPVGAGVGIGLGILGLRKILKER